MLMHLCRHAPTIIHDSPDICEHLSVFLNRYDYHSLTEPTSPQNHLEYMFAPSPHRHDRAQQDDVHTCVTAGDRPQRNCARGNSGGGLVSIQNGHRLRGRAHVHVHGARCVIGDGVLFICSRIAPLKFVVTRTSLVALIVFSLCVRTCECAGFGPWGDYGYVIFTCVASVSMALAASVALTTRCVMCLRKLGLRPG